MKERYNDTRVRVLTSFIHHCIILQLTNNFRVFALNVIEIF